MDALLDLLMGCYLAIWREEEDEKRWGKVLYCCWLQEQCTGEGKEKEKKDYARV